MKLTKKHKIALFVVLVALDVWATYDMRRRMYTRLWRTAVEPTT